MGQVHGGVYYKAFGRSLDADKRTGARVAGFSFWTGGDPSEIVMSHTSR